MNPYCMTHVYRQISARPWAVVRAEAEKAGQHRASVYIELTDVPARVDTFDVYPVVDSGSGWLRDEAVVHSISFEGGRENLVNYFSEDEQQRIYRENMIQSIELYVDVIWNGSADAPEIADVFIHDTEESIKVLMHQPELVELAQLVRDEVMA